MNSNYKPYKGKKHEMREIMMKSWGVRIAATFLGLSTFLTLFFTVPNIVLTMEGERINMLDQISYALDVDEQMTREEDIESEDIKNYIYNKSGIKNQAVKDYLWNPELIENVIPYYRGSYLNILTKIRHHGLNIEGYSLFDIVTDESVGQYRSGHTIYVRDFDEESFTEESEDSKTVGHEYVHLLQTDSVYAFIAEASAELISHEYFKNSTLSTDSYSYREACKYLRVIMEIIGPGPVWENNFKQNSTALDDSVKPYLTEDEFEEFVTFLNYHPYYQKNSISENLHRFEELLDTIHRNKYGFSMYKDKMIKAILSDSTYSRVYFKDSLRSERRDYCEVTSMSIEDAIENDYIVVTEGDKTSLTAAEFLQEFHDPDYVFAYAPGLRLNEEKGIVEFEVPPTEYIPSINEKFKQPSIIKG